MWPDELDEAAALAVLQERFPDLAAGGVVPAGDGWDTHAFVIAERWVARVARRPTASDGLLREAALLAVIAPKLPSPVPHVEHMSTESPVAVVTRRIAGTPARGGARTGRELGRFLASLHALPVDSLPLPRADVDDWRAEHERRRAEFEQHVFPLLRRDERHRAEQLFAGVAFEFEPCLVHGDLGPEHVLCADDGRITGVLDWADARIGDRAIDLAWALYGPPGEFADAVAAAYGALDAATRKRADFYHRRGPWYEVVYGLEQNRQDLVERGLAGVRARL